MQENQVPSRTNNNFDAVTRRRSELPTVSTQTVIQRMGDLDGHADELTKDRRQTWLERLFPNPIERARLAGDVKMAETEVDFRLRTLRMKREFEMKLIENTLNSVLVRYAAEIRGAMAEDLQRELNNVYACFNREFDVFYKNMTAQIEKAESLRYDLLREAEYQRIQEAIEGFRSQSAKLIAHFENIIEDLIRANGATK
jgi:hypothetical protein